MKISLVLGTRPEIIKLSPIIRECLRVKQDFFILHTGQHYSYKMDKIFFETLDLPEAKYNLDVGSGTHAEQTAKMLVQTEKILLEEKPDIVLVEGDTNTVLAGALAAAKLHIKIGHVEAGLRSYDRQMPEEINRILTDHCSDLLFAPTPQSAKILSKEGIPREKIFTTGNTIVDAVFQNVKIAKQSEKITERLGIEPKKYFVVTVHRQENVDNRENFKGILRGLEMTSEEYDYPIIYPIHPRAKKQLKVFELKPKGIKMIAPLDYLSFLQLESNAKLVLTDSGGIQEETCILGVPCVTLRCNTERPETLEVGSNALAGMDAETIASKVRSMLVKKKWRNPFGDGKAAQRIIRIVREEISTSTSQPKRDMQEVTSRTHLKAEK